MSSLCRHLLQRSNHVGYSPSSTPHPSLSSLLRKRPSLLRKSDPLFLGTASLSLVASATLLLRPNKRLTKAMSSLWRHRVRRWRLHRELIGVCIHTSRDELSANRVCYSLKEVPSKRAHVSSCLLLSFLDTSLLSFIADELSLKTPHSSRKGEWQTRSLMSSL